MKSISINHENIDASVEEIRETFIDWIATWSINKEIVFEERNVYNNWFLQANILDRTNISICFTKLYSMKSNEFLLFL